MSLLIKKRNLIDEALNKPTDPNKIIPDVIDFAVTRNIYWN